MSAGPDSETQSRVLWGAVIFESALAGLAFLLGWILDTPAAGRAYADGLDLLIGCALAAPPALLFIALLHFKLPFLQKIRAELDQSLLALFGRCSILDLALISLLAGVCEELLFRGFLQNALTGALGLWPSLFISNVLFGAAHLITIPYGIYASAMGLLLGLSMEWTDNLVTPIALHALYDFFALVYYVKIVGRRAAES